MNILIATPWKSSGAVWLAINLRQDLEELGHTVRFHAFEELQTFGNQYEREYMAWRTVEIAQRETASDVVIMSCISMSPGWWRKHGLDARDRTRHYCVVWLPLWEKLRPGPWTRFAQEQAVLDRIVAPVEVCRDALQALQYSDIRHCQWSLRTPIVGPRETPKVPVFLHVSRMACRRTDWAVGAWIRYREAGHKAKLHLKLHDPLDRLIPPHMMTRITAGGFQSDLYAISRVVSREDMLGLYRRADLLLHFSEEDGISLPILEALSHGVPVMTNNYPPMNEWVRHGTNGVLIPCTTEDRKTVVAPKCCIDVDEAAKALIKYGHQEQLDRLKLRVHWRLKGRRRAFLQFWDSMMGELARQLLGKFDSFQETTPPVGVGVPVEVLEAD